MRQKNPFEILGISPKGLRGLSRAQVREVVAAMYRVLVRFHHPDMKQEKSRARFAAVQAAYETLTADEDALKFWLTSLRSGGRKQRDLLAQELKELEQRKQVLAQRLHDFWCRRRLLKLSGVFRRGLLNESFGLRPEGFPELFLMSPEGGQHRTSALEKVPLGPEENPPEGAIWPQVVSRNRYYWRQRSGQESAIVGRFIGGIDEHSAREIQQQLPSVERELLAGHDRSFDCAAPKSMPIERFRNFIEMVKPEVRPGDEAVLLCGEGELRFEGKLIHEWSDA